MRGRPEPPTILVILVMQVSLRQSVIRSIQRATIAGAGVRGTSMGQIRPENEGVTYRSP